MFLRHFSNKYLHYIVIALLGYFITPVKADTSSFNQLKEEIPELTNSVSTSYKKTPEGIDIRIDTPNFTLRTFNMEDLNFIKSLYQSPLFDNNFRPGGCSLSDKDFEEVVEEWKEVKKDSPFTLYVLEDRQKKTSIGVLDIVHYENNPSILEISYIISQNNQKHGWGITLMQTVMNNLIPLLKKESELEGITELGALVLKDNIGSSKILEKVGFVLQPAEWKTFKYFL